MKFKIILISVLMIVGYSMVAQDDEDGEFSARVTRVNNTVYMLQGRGGNIGFSIGEDGIFMIDDQFDEAVEENMKRIQSLKNAPVQFLVNTHHHGDHTGGNSKMAKMGAVIVSHENVRLRLEEILKNSEEKSDGENLPIITFKDNMTFYYNGEEINIFHVKNAHTDGDVMIYFNRSNVLHTGDVFFAKRYPYIDLKNGGSVEGYIQALGVAIKRINASTKVIPGHGDIASIADLQYTQQMLGNIQEDVFKQYGMGKTLEEVLAMTHITAKYDAQGFGDHFITNQDILRLMYANAEAELGEEIEQRRRDLDDIQDLKKQHEEIKAKKEEALKNQELRLKDKPTNEEVQKLKDKMNEDGDGGGL
jgi:cyclase